MGSILVGIRESHLLSFRTQLICQGKLGKFGKSSGNMDRDEGHTMKHLHGHEPAIEWYDPPGMFIYYLVTYRADHSL